MRDTERVELAQITLAPYIQKATALIGHKRKVGGNQFRHAMATLAILIDYNQFDPVLLKAAVIHDLIEDVPDTNLEELRQMDHDGAAVVNLVLEVTRREESRIEYLKAIKAGATKTAKILKVADRISNLTDLNKDIFTTTYMSDYLDETLRYVLPIAQEVNRDMALEIKDLVRRRRKLLDCN